MLELRDIEFEKISQLVYSHCGIHLHDGKKELVKARLSKRIREGNFRSFADYFEYVKTGEGTDEFIAMIDSLSTNLTSFFREDGHFRALARIVPALLREQTPRGRPRLRLWSAGCSTGEEPYTMAITALEAAQGTQCRASHPGHGHLDAGAEEGRAGHLSGRPGQGDPARSAAEVFPDRPGELGRALPGEEGRAGSRRRSSASISWIPWRRAIPSMSSSAAT